MREQKLGVQGFSYWHDEIDAALLNQFAELVDKTWQRLPEEARKSLRIHWNGSQIPIPIGIQKRIGTSPRIECFDGFLPDQPKSVPAITEHVGHGFQFNLHKIRRMPPDVAHTLIAHELAHAYTYSDHSELIRILNECGNLNCIQPFNGNWYEFHNAWRIENSDQRRDCGIRDGIPWFKPDYLEENLLEKRAREINRKWGNDEDQLTAWLQFDALSDLPKQQKALLRRFERKYDCLKLPMNDLTVDLKSLRLIHQECPAFGDNLPLFRIEDWAWELIQKNPAFIQD